MATTTGEQRPVSAAESIASMIRESIYEGRILPGEHLVEGDLAARFGVSRGPAREAVRLLVAEGVAHLIPNRGAFIASPTIDDVFEVYAMRLSLGILAFDVACRTDRVTDRVLGDLHLKLSRLKRSGIRGNQLQMVAADLDFQTALIAASGLERVTQFFERGAMEIRLFVQTLRIPYAEENHDEIIQHHERRLELLEERDSEALTEMWIDHIQRNVEEFTSYFPERTGDVLANPVIVSALRPAKAE